MARKLLDGARGAVGGAAGAARHLVWYLSYCVDASATRPSPADDRAPEPALSRAS